MRKDTEDIEEILTANDCKQAGGLESEAVSIERFLIN
jgi:hypothetical protein